MGSTSRCDTTNKDHMRMNVFSFQGFPLNFYPWLFIALAVDDIVLRLYSLSYILQKCSICKESWEGFNVDLRAWSISSSLHEPWINSGTAFLDNMRLGREM